MLGGFWECLPHPFPFPKGKRERPHLHGVGGTIPAPSSFSIQPWPCWLYWGCAGGESPRQSPEPSAEPRAHCRAQRLCPAPRQHHSSHLTFPGMAVVHTSSWKQTLCIFLTHCLALLSPLPLLLSASLSAPLHKLPELSPMHPSVPPAEGQRLSFTELHAPGPACTHPHGLMLH